VLLAVLVLLFGVFSFKSTLKFNGVIGLLAFLIVFFFGYFRLQHFKDDFQEIHLVHFKGEFEAYRATVVEQPENKPNSTKAVVTINEIFKNDSAEFWTAKVNLYLDKELGKNLKYGDQLLIQGQPNLMVGPMNPGEFDYRNYLIYNNIFHQHFVGDRFVVLGNAPPSTIMYYAFKLRTKCQDILTNMIDDDAVRGVVLALVIGVKDELDVDVRKAYSAAGAMHVLAVSGLHVGIIYAIILLLFKRLGLVNKNRRWQLAVISILVLWLYAFITGLSPSVLRAVTMFSFVAIGKASKRNTNIYNTLAASAFVLLWYNPYLIMSVGFQLSYLAVFGIVYLQPKFYNLLTVKNVLLDKVWAITCVSLAAQIATGPLSILYFHQFPSYFFVSNLFIIPAALVILVLGLVVLIFGWVPFFGEATAWLLSKIVSATNALVYTVEGIPGSVIQGVNIKSYESWLIYFCIVFLILLFSTKKFKYLVWAALMSFSFGLSQIFERSKFIDKSTVSVFNVSNTSVVDFASPNGTSLIGDSAFINNDDKLRFSIQPKRLISYQGINVKNDQLKLSSAKIIGADLFVFQGESFLIINDPKIQTVISEKRISIDNIILSREAIKDLTQLTALFEFNRIIIDRSNRKYLVDKLTSQADKLNLDIHSISESGFLEINLSR